MSTYSNLLSKDLFLIVQGWVNPPAELGAEDRARMLDILDKSLIAKTYVPLLAARLPELKLQFEGAPETVSEATTLLRETQDRLDDYERALFHACLALTEAPDVPQERRLSAQKIQAALVPSLSKRSYADEAAQVVTHTEALTRLAGDLERAGPDIQRWAQGVAAEESRVAQLLDARQLITGGVQRSRSVRGDVLRQINEFRAAFRSELTINQALPPNAEALVFAILDDLARRRNAAPKPETPATV